MDRKDFLKDYWGYYLMLERRFMHTTDYVELNPENYKTYSKEYASLLQMIGSEIDAFFKVYCGIDTVERKSIKDYAECVLREYPEIVSQAVIVEGERLEIIPFTGWNIDKPSQSLLWWEAYNGIKHNRVSKKTGGSLENVLNALAALYILEMKYLSKITSQNGEIDIPNKESALFILKGWSFRYTSMAQTVSMFADGALYIRTDGD